MIADTVYFAIAAVGFCHAVGRSLILRGFRAGMNKLMPQDRTKRRGRARRRYFIALIKNS